MYEALLSLENPTAVCTGRVRELTRRSPGLAFPRSEWFTNRGQFRMQPVPPALVFSRKLLFDGLHASVSGA